MSINRPEDFHIHEHPEEIANPHKLNESGLGNKMKDTLEWSKFLAVLILAMIYTHVFLRGDKK